MIPAPLQEIVDDPVNHRGVLREVEHPAIVRPRELLRLAQALGPPFVLPAGTAVLIAS